MRFHSLFLAAILIIVALAAPGCSSEPEDVPLSGTWTGTATDAGDTITSTWEIRESGGVITGTASIASGPLSVTGDVTGSYMHPDVSMTLTVVIEGDTFTLRWVGTRTGDDMLTGVVHDPDDPDGDQTPLPLRRE